MNLVRGKTTTQETWQTSFLDLPFYPLSLPQGFERKRLRQQRFFRGVLGLRISPRRWGNPEEVIDNDRQQCPLKGYGRAKEC